MTTKIQPEHLCRRAIVYVRQSTMDQVRSNQESQRLQYAMADRARELGWPDVEVIDEDLGRSGGGLEARPGFTQLVAAVSMQQIGAVFSLEASRLARNNRDWYQLIDMCSLVGTLLVDQEGVYDPRLLDDRLLLGLKGTMSEFELGLFRRRAQEALAQKAARGELFTTLPVGYVRTPDDRCEKDPDRRVQQAIKMVFERFELEGSVRQTLLWFRQEGVPLPCLISGGLTSRVEWKPPVYNTILHILQNPTYAGVYAYGRTRTTVEVVEGELKRRRGNQLPKQEWSVFIPNHHDGYISLECYERNQQRIRENASMRAPNGRGAPRRGSALLAGLLRCRRCGRKLHVTYSGTRGDVPRYGCRGAHVNHGTERCISFGGLAVDRAISEQVLGALEPAALDQAIERETTLFGEHKQQRQAKELALQQARYEAARIFRQYNAVEPENRLVAAELEHRLESALESVKQQERDLTLLPDPSPPTEEQRRLLRWLGGNFAVVWNHPAADSRLKKRIVRYLIHEIVVDVVEQEHVIQAIIHWHGGSHTELRLPKRRTGQHRFTTSHEAVDLIRSLARLSPDRAIASVLNRLGFTTGRGNGWTEGRVRSARAYHGIAAFDPDERARAGWLTMAEAAQELSVSPMSVRRMLQTGILRGEQVVPYAPWVILHSDLQQEAVQQEVRRVRGEGKCPLPADPNQLNLGFEPTVAR